MMTKLKTKLDELSAVRKHFGTKAMLLVVADHLGRRLVKLRVSEVVWLDVADVSDSLRGDPEFEFRFLSAEEVARFAADPATELSEMVERARSPYDLCFAALCGDRLAAYGWYALRGIEPEHCAGVAMSYPAEVAYMYKGLTLPDFRGKRLHGLIMGLALKALGARGVTAIVSTVDWINFPSLKSCDRLGYQNLGRFATVGRGDRLICVPRRALERGVRLGKEADLSGRTKPAITADEQEPVAAGV